MKFTLKNEHIAKSLKSSVLFCAISKCITKTLKKNMADPANLKTVLVTSKTITISFRNKPSEVVTTPMKVRIFITRFDRSPVEPDHPLWQSIAQTLIKDGFDLPITL